MRNRLTKKQKSINARNLKVIRKGYQAVQGRISYLGFKHRVQARMKAENLSAKEATKKELNTESFVSAAERSRVNLVESIKEKFKDEYEELRNLSREKGKFKSIKENLQWDTTRNGYVLGGKYFIDVSNSPEEVNIYAI